MMTRRVLHVRVSELARPETLFNLPSAPLSPTHQPQQQQHYTALCVCWKRKLLLSTYPSDTAYLTILLFARRVSGAAHSPRVYARRWRVESEGKGLFVFGCWLKQRASETELSKRAHTQHLIPFYLLSSRLLF
jgi:hypothetical protein